MDLSNVELHYIGYLSSAQDTLKRARSIINLAESNSENARTLAACATILLTAALEQAVKTKLSEAAEIIGLEKGIHSSETSPGRYLDIKIPSRTRSLPRVLTESCFQLDPSHEITETLEELIETRNNLAHVDEPAKHLTVSNGVRVEDDRISVSFFQPLNPWGTVTLESVKRFEHAVDVYFTEVLFPESGRITEGTIVIPAH